MKKTMANEKKAKFKLNKRINKNSEQFGGDWIHGTMTFEVMGKEFTETAYFHKPTGVACWPTMERVFRHVRNQVDSYKRKVEYILRDKHAYERLFEKDRGVHLHSITPTELEKIATMKRKYPWQDFETLMAWAREPMLIPMTAEKKAKKIAKRKQNTKSVRM